MRSTINVVLFGAILLAGCGEPSGTGSSEDTTRDLLASASQEGTTGQDRVPAQEPTIDVALLGYDHGQRSAPVRVVEMSDFGCSFCREFHLETWPMILEKFVEPGKVEWKFLPFVNGMFKNSPSALRAAECTLEQDAELFLTVTDRLWTDQREWKGSADPDPLLRGWVEAAGADMERFDSCLGEDRRGERIAAANALTRQLGVRGTPTFFIIGYQPIQGALPAEEFENILNLVYADATQGAPED
ncbi:MAG: thioredoxin domain-containing protein [Gemmatimonadota bacterium]|jgi:protein-disulfide isomerase